MKKQIVVLLLISICSSCASFYHTNYSFNQNFENGDLNNALETLRSSGMENKNKQEFLFFVNNGLVLSMLGRYQESNEFFEKAYLFGEDYRKNYLNEIASYLTNPTFTAYRGEDHEHLMLLYYKAINYLKMGKSEEALVECRRLNIRLSQLSDRYQSENKYKEDAFIHCLMGIIYQSDKDYNNAFIAYRNAIDIFQSDYQRMFGMFAPEQLKTDLLDMAFLSGLTDEVEWYKDKFGMDGYEYTAPTNGELIFFWHNGLSPVKAEWSINFYTQRQNDWAIFSNPVNNLSFSFPLENESEKDKRDLGNLETFRVAFPKYVARSPQYTNSWLEIGESRKNLELIEDVNKIAIHSLQERMNLEFSKALLRVALKKVTEYQIKKEDQLLGSLVGLLNIITEKADTRNWQTLPYQIHYTRVHLVKGTNHLMFNAEDNKGMTSKSSFVYEGKKGQTLFHTFSSLESEDLPFGYN